MGALQELLTSICAYASVDMALIIEMSEDMGVG